MPSIHTTARVFALGVAIVLISALFTSPAQAETIIDCPQTIQPGQPFVLSISSDKTLRDVSIRWRGKDLALPIAEPAGPFAAQTGQTGETILAMPLDGTEKSLPLRISYTENGQAASRNFTLPVTPKDYPTQELKVESKFVNVNEADTQRADIERKRNNETTARYTSQRMWTLPFFRPVPGELSSRFGLRRVFNGQPRSAHRGLDFRAAAGDPIHAVADGVVALADNQFFAGNVVYVDHGLGVFSIYMHMSEIGVQEGEKITRGQVLGKVGGTGRATGPHLHLSLILQGVGADPLPLLENK